jgi:hypothetical protein
VIPFVSPKEIGVVPTKAPLVTVYPLSINAFATTHVSTE